MKGVAARCAADARLSQLRAGHLAQRGDRGAARLCRGRARRPLLPVPRRGSRPVANHRTRAVVVLRLAVRVPSRDTRPAQRRSVPSRHGAPGTRWRRSRRVCEVPTTSGVPKLQSACTSHAPRTRSANSGKRLKSVFRDWHCAQKPAHEVLRDGARRRTWRFAVSPEPSGNC